MIDNELHKQCGKCKVWKSVRTDFYLRKRATGSFPRAWCKACENEGRVKHGLVPLASVAPVLRFVVDRVGQAEAARRIGVGSGHVWRYLQCRQPRIRRDIAIRMFEVALQIRHDNESRTKNQKRYNPELRKQNKTINS